MAAFRAMTTPEVGRTHKRWMDAAVSAGVLVAMLRTVHSPCHGIDDEVDLMYVNV